MDTNISNIPQLEVENIDDEVFYRETQGWTAEIEGYGDCAVLTSGDNRVRICENPEHRMARIGAEGFSGVDNMEATC